MKILKRCLILLGLGMNIFLIGCQSNTAAPTSRPTSDLYSIFGLQQHEKFELFLRAFKHEQILEIWIKKASETHFTKAKVYNFCTTSGTLGPKRQEGDRQIPEGFYFIDRFNPNSKFHLSLGINYPNPADKILGHPQQPGSDIFIHGGCASVGCIPITDPKIEEVYGLAQLAQQQGQMKIQVHIFPFRMTSNQLTALGQKHPQFQAFWKELAPAFEYFETKKQLPKVHIQENGQYVL